MVSVWTTFGADWTVSVTAKLLYPKASTPKAYAGILQNGNEVAGAHRMAWEMVKGYLSKIQVNSTARKRNYGLGRLIQLVRRQYTRTYDLKEIDRVKSIWRNEIARKSLL